MVIFINNWMKIIKLNNYISELIKKALNLSISTKYSRNKVLT